MTINKYKLITTVGLFLIVVMTFFVVRDRYNFHKNVIKTANYCIELIFDEQLQKVTENNPECNADSIFCIKKGFQQIENSLDLKYNHNNPIKDKYDYNKELLEVLEKSDGLLSANGLTFLTTMIVALLAALLLYRLDDMEKLSAETKIMKNEIKDKHDKIDKTVKGLGDFNIKINSYYNHTVKYDYLQIRIESIYNLSIIMGNVVMALSPDNTSEFNESTLRQVGILCHRLSKMCRQIELQLHDPTNRLDFVTQEEKNILDTYIEDSLGELEGNRAIAKKINNPGLNNMMQNQINRVNDIREILNDVEIQTFDLNS
ncbi:MAG: hypothetical protein J6W18_04245 [Bacteroidaceae bacterium]|nr:hypothetical protein [Bacteroidaceae bacterium]